MTAAPGHPLAEEIGEILRDPEEIATMADQGFSPATLPSEPFALILMRLYADDLDPVFHAATALIRARSETLRDGQALGPPAGGTDLAAVAREIADALDDVAAGKRNADRPIAEEGMLLAVLQVGRDHGADPGLVHARGLIRWTTIDCPFN